MELSRQSKFLIFNCLQY